MAESSGRVLHHSQTGETSRRRAAPPPPPPPKTPPSVPPKDPPPVPPKSPRRPSFPNRLLTYEEVPRWLQDNVFIRSGYRAPSYSIPKSLVSIFSLHNETVNIHSHLLAAVFFLSFPLWTPLPSATLSLLPFLSGAVFCLSTSALYHTLLNVSPHTARHMNQADYCGIVALISGSFVASVHFGFTCAPHLRSAYWALVAVLGTGCGVVSTDMRFRTPAWRPFRAGMFVAFGGSAVFPVLHGWALFGWDELERRISASRIVVHGALYVVGAGLYAARVPERWWPGRVDLFGSSHQIFHLLVVAAACTHLSGLLKAAANADIPCEIT